MKHIIRLLSLNLILWVGIESAFAGPLQALRSCVPFWRTQTATPVVPQVTVRTRNSGISTTFESLAAEGRFVAQNDALLPRSTHGHTCVPTTLSNLLLAAAEIHSPGRIRELGRTDLSRLQRLIVQRALSHHQSANAISGGAGVDARLGMLGLNAMIRTVEPLSRDIPGLIVPELVVEEVYVPDIRVEDLVRQFATGNYVMVVAVTNRGTHAMTITNVEQRGPDLIFKIFDPLHPNASIEARALNVQDSTFMNLQIVSTGEDLGSMTSALSVRLPTASPFVTRTATTPSPIRSLPQNVPPGYTAVTFPYRESFSFAGTVSKSGRWVSVTSHNQLIMTYRTQGLNVNEPTFSNSHSASINEIQIHEAEGHTYQLIASADNKLHAYPLGLPQQRIQSPIWPSENQQTLSWENYSPNGKFLATAGSLEGPMGILDRRPTQLNLIRFHQGRVEQKTIADVLPNNFGGGVAFIDDTTLALGGRDGQVHLFRIENVAGAVGEVQLSFLRRLQVGETGKWITQISLIHNRQSIVAVSGQESHGQSSNGLTVTRLSTGERLADYNVSEDRAELNANVGIQQNANLYRVTVPEGSDDFMIHAGHRGREFSSQGIMFSLTDQYGGIGHNSGYRSTVVQGMRHVGYPIRMPNGQWLLTGHADGLVTISDAQFARPQSVYYPGVVPNVILETYDPSTWAKRTVRAENGVILIMAGWGAQILIPEVVQ